MSARRLGLVLALLAAGCRASGSAGRTDEPDWVELGRGAPERVAQRAVVALLDSPRVASAAPRVSSTDARYHVTLDTTERADVGTLAAWRVLVRRAVDASGRVLLLREDSDGAAVLRASCRGPLEDATASIELRTADGRTLFRARGQLSGPDAAR